MSENENGDHDHDNDNDNVTSIDSDESEPTTEMDERDHRILELEHLAMLQGNTITAFSNRNHELEMRIVELMSQIEFNSNVGRRPANIPGPPPTIPQ